MSEHERQAQDYYDRKNQRAWETTELAAMVITFMVICGAVGLAVAIFFTAAWSLITG